MKFLTAALSGAALPLICLLLPTASAQDLDEVRALVESARDAAGEEHQFVFGQLCAGPIRAVNAPPVEGAVPSALPSNDPDRDWYAEPVRVFDDLYFPGQTAFSVWGLRTPEGGSPGRASS